MINQINISPVFKGIISITDLLTPKGKLQMLPVNNDNNNIFSQVGTFFNLKGEDFYFQLSADYTGLYLERNGEQCIITPDMLTSRQLRFFIMTWSPTTLRLVTAESKEKHIDVIKHTPPFSVPVSFKKWARDKTLIPTKFYNTEIDFRNAVYQCLTDLRSKIEENGSSESFWDFSYDGNKVKLKTPKKETLAQPLVKTIIDTELYLRGIDIFRENTTPSGDIDFTVVGYVNGVGIVNMCIELKNAHSEYLENGLLNQLPNYMRSQKSQYGAYCVLNYNVENGDNIKRNELIEKLSLLQYKSNDSLVQTKIKVVVIDLDKKIIANKQK